MKFIIYFLSALALMLVSAIGFARGPEGSASIKATLEVVKPYVIEATNLEFGEQVVPKQGADNINIKPGSSGASQLTIEGSDGEATVSLANKGDFILSGSTSGDRLDAKAFFDNNKASDKITLVEGKATTSVGGQVKLTPATAADNYTGNVTVNVAKNI